MDDTSGWVPQSALDHNPLCDITLRDPAPAAGTRPDRDRRPDLRPRADPADRRKGAEAVRILLHVGSNKTGSTAIQETCHAFRDTLLAEGVLYPDLGRPHHSDLILAVLDDEEYRGNFNRNTEDGRRRGTERSEALWDELRAQVAARKPATLLLSSEFMFGMRPASFERLIARLTALSEDISAVVYLREPGDHYLSSSQQIIKYGAAVKDPRERQGYSAKLDKLCRLVPGTVEPRVFSRALLFRKDVSFDLLSAVIPKKRLREIEIAPVVSNTSLSAEGMALLQEFNAQVWQDVRKVGNPVNKALLASLSQAEKKMDTTKAALRPDIREVVRQIHLNDLKRMRDTFGIAFETFDYDSAPAGGVDLEDDAYARLGIGDIVDYDPSILRDLTYQTMATLSRRVAKE